MEFIVFSEAFRNFFAVKAVSILLGLAAIPTLFYTCAGAFGELPGWGNILIFFLADALAYLVGYRWLTDGRLRGGRDAACGLCAAVGSAVRICLVHLPHAAPAVVFGSRERLLRRAGSLLKRSPP